MLCRYSKRKKVSTSFIQEEERLVSARLKLGCMIWLLSPILTAHQGSELAGFLLTSSSKILWFSFADFPTLLTLEDGTIPTTHALLSRILRIMETAMMSMQASLLTVQLMWANAVYSAWSGWSIHHWRGPWGWRDLDRHQWNPICILRTIINDTHRSICVAQSQVRDWWLFHHGSFTLCCVVIATAVVGWVECTCCVITVLRFGILRCLHWESPLKDFTM